MCAYIYNSSIKKVMNLRRKALGKLEVGRGGGNDINAVVMYEILKTPKH